MNRTMPYYALLVLLLAAALAVRVMTRADPLREPAAVLGTGGSDGATPELVIVLQPGTCAANLAGSRYWNAAHASGRIRVSALIVGGPASPRELDSLTLELGFRFPVSAGDGRATARLLGSMGFRSTPTAIILDGQGRVRAALPAGRLATEALLESAIRLAR